MKFKKEVLQAIIYDDCINADKVGDTIQTSTRWSILHTMIFKYKDKFYMADYSVGATELQEERPYEYAADKIECPEVELKEVMIKKWVLVEK